MTRPSQAQEETLISGLSAGPEVGSTITGLSSSRVMAHHDIHDCLMNDNAR